MGKGDKKTRRGKIVNKSSGKRRQKKNTASKPKPKKIVSKAKATPKPKVEPKVETKEKVEVKEQKEVKPKASAKKTTAAKEKKEPKK